METMLPELKVSTMTGKMEGIPAISTDPRSNKNCQDNRKIAGSICHRCYAHVATSYRVNLGACLSRNSAILSESTLKDQQIPRTVSRVFRFESHGDLINGRHLRNLVAICEANPGTTFTLWTKNYRIPETMFKTVAKPANLILVYSSLMIGKPLKIAKFKYADKIFTVYAKDTTETMNCIQSCAKCLKCYTKSDRTKYIKEHVHA